MSKTVKSYITGIGLFVVLILIDQLSKLWAVSNLKGNNSVSVIANVLSLTYLENPGSAWGMLENAQWIVVIISFAVVIFIGYYYKMLSSDKKYNPIKYALVVLASGAVGNVIDRLTRGVVVDFLEFKFIQFPVFNVADIYVTVSVVVIFILVMFVYKEDDFKFKTND